MDRRKRRKTAQTRRRTSVHDLPDDCLALVFPFLKSRADRDAASLTCRRWRALDALSRHSLHFSDSKRDKGHYLHHRLLHALKVFPHILSLGVHCFHRELPGFFLTLFRTKVLSGLQSVEFFDSSSRIDDAFVQCVARCCSALRHFSIDMCEVTDVGLCALAHGCRHLTSVHVPCCHATDKGIDTLLTMCPSMEILCVTENLEISGWGFRHGKKLRQLDVGSCFLSDDSLIETWRMATGLETLDLGNVTFDIEFLGQGCPTLASVGTYCKLLVKLELSWSGVDDSSLQAIAQGCLNLKVLEAESCEDVTFLGWQAVALSCLKLELLNVAGCDQFYDDSLFATYKGCPSLTHLKISHRFFPPNRIFKRFQLFRQNVDVTFYDDEGKQCPLVLT